MSDRALEGVRVLVTRPELQAGPMMDALRAVGAEPVLFPVIRIDEPADGGAALRAAARAIDSFDWVVLGSANAAERLLEALDAAEAVGLGAGEIPVAGESLVAGEALKTGAPVAPGTTPRWACVGPGTAGVLREAGIEPDLVAPRHVAEGLLEALEGVPLAGRRVLLPQAELARPVLASGLSARGADVHVVHAYRTLPDAPAARDVRERLVRGDIGVLTFTSSSTVERFVAAVGSETGGALVAAIGPVTAATAAALGLEAGVVAETHTVEGLIEALVEHYGKSGRFEQS